MRLNYTRPILLILVAITAKSLVEWIGLMAGMEPIVAENIGFMAMIVAGIATYLTFVKQRRK